MIYHRIDILSQVPRLVEQDLMEHMSTVQVYNRIAPTLISYAVFCGALFFFCSFLV